MKFSNLTWLFVLLIITSVVQAAEVISSTNDLSNTIHTRTLAASCGACHGTNGNAVSSSIDNNEADSNFTLAGIDSKYFVAQMIAFKNGSRPATVMHHHAKGLNEDEINLLAVYFSQQKRLISQSPKPQSLKASP
jgi:cytochrome subunit of sulfide dehydrogenase